MRINAKNSVKKYLMILLISCGFLITAFGLRICAETIASPTLNINKITAERGEHLIFFGESFPGSEILLSIDSANNSSFYVKTITGKDGRYSYAFDTSLLDAVDNEFYVKSKASLNDRITEFGKPVKFSIGEKSIVKSCSLLGDLNYDCKINLIDISIMAKWFKSDFFSGIAYIDLNNDKMINIIDFGILIKERTE